MSRFCLFFTVFCWLLPFSVNAINWDLVNEEFNADGNFGAFTTVEHTGADRTAEVKGGHAILKRINAGADIGPTMRAYFDDPNVNQFIMYAKIDAKAFGSGHFLVAMRINGFEYLPSIAEDSIGDHESVEQWSTGIRKQEVKASTKGMHEYIILGKSKDAYDLYFDKKLIIKDGVTRPLAGAVWEVAQMMIHIRKGTDLEIHVDTAGVKQGNDELDQLLSASALDPDNKLSVTWGKIKGRSTNLSL